MKVLSIGNSFSQDAHRWLHALAAQHGVELETVGLVSGGCSLERHCRFAAEHKSAYRLEQNGVDSGRSIGLDEALAAEDWDAVTLQQVSELSGIPASYEPYLQELAEMVRAACPRAALYFHQTWAYETDAVHPGFSNYHHNQEVMYRAVRKTAAWAAELIDAKLIPTGDAIQALRRSRGAFCRETGGISLCRDGYHLSLDYGRYAAAAVWLRTLAGVPISAKEFEGFDLRRLEQIAETVNAL